MELSSVVSLVWALPPTPIAIGTVLVSPSCWRVSQRKAGGGGTQDEDDDDSNITDPFEDIDLTTCKELAGIFQAAITCKKKAKK
ncbi:hypothetical protein FDECE_11211 [Fusarium decemcellulare]|nr:hypothetical protein FDECE_11211 [Fusarium decemcellulare]